MGAMGGGGWRVRGSQGGQGVAACRAGRSRGLGGGAGGGRTLVLAGPISKGVYSGRCGNTKPSVRPYNNGNNNNNKNYIIFFIKK